MIITFKFLQKPAGNFLIHFYVSIGGTIVRELNPHFRFEKEYCLPEPLLSGKSKEGKVGGNLEKLNKLILSIDKWGEFFSICKHYAYRCYFFYK